MTTTLQEILTYPFFAFLHLETAPETLQQEVSSMGILEYEYENSQEPARKFDPQTLVLTSLYFAKDRPEILLSTIRWLHRDGVTGLLVKKIFFQQLPIEVLHYANEQNFPILTYEKQATPHFEDILLKVKEILSFEAGQAYLERLLGEMLTEDGSSYPLQHYFLHKKALAAEQLRVLYLQNAAEEAKIYHWLASLSELPRHFYTIEGIKYRQGFFLFVFIKKKTANLNIPQLLEQLQLLGVAVSASWIGESQAIQGLDLLKKACQEALISARYSQIYQLPQANYANLGIMQWLLPHSQQPELQVFSQNLLKKIAQADVSADKKLHQAAEVFVTCGGDIKKMAATLQIHENSIRYRLQKLREVLGAPTAPLNLYDLYQQLDIAFKIQKLNPD